MGGVVGARGRERGIFNMLFSNSHAAAKQEPPFWARKKSEKVFSHTTHYSLEIGFNANACFKRLLNGGKTANGLVCGVLLTICASSVLVRYCLMPPRRAGSLYKICTEVAIGMALGMADFRGQVLVRIRHTLSI
jgi:hypothetical protein